MNAALRLLSDEQSSGVLDLSEDIINVLKEKHPLPADIKLDLPQVYFVNQKNWEREN